MTENLTITHTHNSQSIESRPMIQSQQGGASSGCLSNAGIQGTPEQRLFLFNRSFNPL